MSKLRGDELMEDISMNSLPEAPYEYWAKTGANESLVWTIEGVRTLKAIGEYFCLPCSAQTVRDISDWLRLRVSIARVARQREEKNLANLYRAGQYAPADRGVIEALLFGNIYDVEEATIAWKNCQDAGNNVIPVVGIRTGANKRLLNQ